MFVHGWDGWKEGRKEVWVCLAEVSAYIRGPGAGWAWIQVGYCEERERMGLCVDRGWGVEGFSSAVLCGNSVACPEKGSGATSCVGGCIDLD